MRDGARVMWFRQKVLVSQCSGGNFAQLAVAIVRQRNFAAKLVLVRFGKNARKSYIPSVWRYFLDFLAFESDAH